MELKHLKYLDLSGNQFDGVKIPEFFGSLKELKHLNISYARFVGRIPHHLGNLSYLELLDVSSSAKSYSYYMSQYETLIYSSCLNADSLDWMVNMPLLKHLEMNFVNLSMIGSRWFHVMNSLSSLQVLHLRGSYLSDIPPALPFMNLTQLRSLDLGYNQFFSEIPNWFANITTLVSIDLDANKFYGDMSSKFPTLPCLEELQLAYNYGLTAHLSKLFQGPWKSIKAMLLFGVHVRVVPSTLVRVCVLNQTGSMHEWLCPLVNLQILRIEKCNFPESIPTCLGGFSSLTFLSFRNSMLKGPVLQEHFQNLSKLRYLDLSFNSFEFHTPLDWVPSFQVEFLYLGSCRFGSQLPLWLQSQKKLYGLDLSYSSLGIIPSWFWNITPHLLVVILRMNNISGSLPTKTISTLSNAWFIDLSHNYFKGPIPYFPSPLDRVVLSMNGQQNEYTSILYLVISLDLSGNNLSGKIPEAIGDLLGLINLNLSGNQLSGKIPESIGNLHQLENLDLSKNHLSCLIPSTIADLTFLRHLNLSYNNLSGKIPLGQQIQSLDDPSIYAGNEYLCGYPLRRDCERDTIVPIPSHDEVDDGFDIAWLYAGIGPGFAVGLLTVFGILLFKTSWRVKYFRFVDAMQECFHW
ncbi:receptor-like protein EIX2 [Aristolochia californica]|uniref:receptor-like protein EIX2 n=1 Tax=Aristolochia californica TaxID=171875 RepID=UPI0035DE52D4